MNKTERYYDKFNNKTIPVTFRIEPHYYARIEKLARDEEKTVSTWIKDFVKEFLKEYN